MLKALVFSALFAVSGAASSVPPMPPSDLSISDPAGNSLTLHPGRPCDLPKVEEKFRESGIPEVLSASSVLYDGKKYRACYMVRDGVVFMIDESLDLISPIPLRAFKDRTI